MIKVKAIRNPFAPLTAEERLYRNTMTVGEAYALQKLDGCSYPVTCMVNGAYILPSDDWSTWKIPDGGLCVFEAHPQGGQQGGGKKNVLAMVLILVVLVIITVISFGTLSWLTGPAGAAVVGTGAGLYVAVAAVTLAAGLLAVGATYLINMALPPTFAKTPDAIDPVYSIASRANQVRIGAPIEVQFGRLKVAPSLCVNPYSDFTGDITKFIGNQQSVGSQTLYEIYNLGWGEYEVEGYELLDQDVGAFSEVVINKFDPGQPITSFPTSVKTVLAVSELELVWGTQNGTINNNAQMIEIQQPNQVHNRSSEWSLSIRGFRGGTFTLVYGADDTGNALQFGNPHKGDTCVGPQDIEDALNALASVNGGVDAESANAPRGWVECTGPRYLWDGPITIKFNGGIWKNNEIENFELDYVGTLLPSIEEYPNWGTIEVTGRCTDSGFETLEGYGYCGWVEDTNKNLGAANSLAEAGHLIVLYGKIEGGGGAGEENAQTLPYSEYFGREGQYVATVVKNTEHKIWWQVPVGSHLDTNDSLPWTYAEESLDDNKSSRFHTILLGNWKGPYKINDSPTDDLVNRIGFDIVLPGGHYHKSSIGNYLDIVIMWRFEYMEIDEYGNPLSGKEYWVPFTLEDKYIQGMIEGDTVDIPLRWRQAANVAIGGHENSPVRFTLNFDVSPGRYQVRAANVSQIPHLVGDGLGGIFAPYSYEADPKYIGVPNYHDHSVDAFIQKGEPLQSYWTGLRGYGVTDVAEWPGRTTITLQIKATENVNASTLRAFSVICTRKLRDYVGVVGPGTFPPSPFSTVVFEPTIYASKALEEGRIVLGNTIPLNTPYAKVSVSGIEDYVKVGDWVRISASSVGNDGEYQVCYVNANYLEILGDLESEYINDFPNLRLGVRRVYARCPNEVSDLEVTGASTIITPTGDFSVFSIGDTINLSNFLEPENNIKTVITDIPDSQTLEVEATTLVLESYVPARVSSVAPDGLVGSLLDGALLSLSAASAIGGITSTSINSSTIGSCRIGTGDPFSPFSLTKYTVKAIGCHTDPAFVVGKTVRLHGFNSERNNISAIITDIDTNKLVLDRMLDWEDELDTAIPVTSEAQSVTVGERPFYLTGDNAGYFIADEGSTSAATDAGGAAVTYTVNEWTAVQATRRISTALRDLATNADYGAGLPERRVNLQDLRDRETTWDSRDRYEEDGVTWKLKPIKDRCDMRLSDRVGYHDANIEIARCGRARVVYPSGVMTVVRDEPRQIPDGMYTSRNIVAGSLEYVVSLPTEDTPDHILMQFYSEDSWDYDEVVISDQFQYLPYQILDCSGSLGGKFNLTYRVSYSSSATYTTDPLAYDLSESDLQTALDGLAGLTAGDFVVTTESTRVYKISYANNLLNRNVPRLYVNNNIYGESYVTGTKVFITQDGNTDYPGFAPSRLLLRGITQRLQAWREGKYELASVQSRRMLATFNTDSEGYIPGYLSRIWLDHESGSWGQHGVLVGYSDTPTSTFYCSEPLDWSAEGQHVIQLRNKMGVPWAAGLHECSPGSKPNEAVLAYALGPEVEADLHIDHQVGREATHYSFGIIETHKLDLLVTGIRPSDKEVVGISGYFYSDIPYLADGDLDYDTITEAEIVGSRKIGPPVTMLFGVLFSDIDGTWIIATWMPTAWAEHYQLSVTRNYGDVDEVWKNITTTKEAYYKFMVPGDLFEDDLLLADQRTAAMILSWPATGATITARHLTQQPTPWVVGAYRDMWLKFTDGQFIGQYFQILDNDEDYLFLTTRLSSLPSDNGDGGAFYEIVNFVPVVWHIGVRAGNEVFGERIVAQVAPPSAGISKPFPSSQYPPVDPNIGGNPDPGDVGTGMPFRQDYYGNIFLSGKVFDCDHVTRYLVCGEELTYDTDVPSVAFLPYTPRQHAHYAGGTRPSIMLFVEDSLITYVTSSPGEGEFTLDGATVNLGFDLAEGDQLHVIMIRGDEDSGALDGIHVGVACGFTPASTAAILPFTPARPAEVLLTLNGDFLFPVAATPGPGEFTLTGTVIETGSTLEASDVLLCLGLDEERTMEADRFHCAKFPNSTLPFLPLWPEQLVIAESGTARWRAIGVGNFNISQTVEPYTTVVWGLPEPTLGVYKYAILMRARA